VASTHGRVGADVPDGFQYRYDFNTADGAAMLVDEIGRVAFSNFEMRGDGRQPALFDHVPNASILTPALRR
jgi:hypothetical protein